MRLIKLYCEGDYDGRRLHTETRESCHGAAKVLLKRIIQDLTGRSRESIKVVPERIRTKIRGPLSEKIRLMVLSDEENADAYVAIVDRDNEENAPRLHELKSGIEAARQEAKAKGREFRCAAGMAIEELESWLLADQAAVQKVIARAHEVENPESLRGPKELLHDWFIDSKVPKADFAKAYDEIAHECNLELVRKKCQSFDAFFVEIQSKLLGPLPA